MADQDVRVVRKSEERVLKRKDRRVDELLAGGTLGGPAYDEILERVIARSQVAPRPFWKRLIGWFVLPGAVLVPVAAWLLFVHPREAPPTPKGSAGAAAVQIGCGPAGGQICHPGDTLMFSVNAALASGHLAAYAERVGDPARERIWYFPTATGRSPMVPPGSGTVVLPEGIRIGSEHPPGEYRVTVWIAKRAISRMEVDADRGDSLAGRETIDLQVIP